MRKKKSLTHEEVSRLGGKAHKKPHFEKMLMARWHPEEYAKKYGVPAPKKVAKVAK